MTRVLVLLLCLTAIARADEPRVDPATCAALDSTPGALLQAEPPSAMPVTWTELEIRGDVIEDRATVKAVLEPTFRRFQTNLSGDKWPEIATTIARFGYQLVGHTVEGPKLIVRIAPLPMVRKVLVDAHQHNPIKSLVDEEIRRRMQVRTGTYLPWERVRRQCALLEERERIADYLHDEGYFDAEVGSNLELEDNAAEVQIDINLGDEYFLGRLDIVPGPNQLAIPDAEIQAVFRPTHWYTFLPQVPTNERFTRTRHQDHLNELRDRFHKAGFPSVRIQSSFDPKTSFDRRTHRVNVTLQIDERRRLDTKFIGNDREIITDDQLRDQLTFVQSGSTDEVEAAASARAIQAYLQFRGFFDARVTYHREPKDFYDQVTYYIDQGGLREVASVDFSGNHALDALTLGAAVATKPAGFTGALFGTNTFATSAQLAADVDRLVETYRRAGFRESRVEVAASTEPVGLGDPALTAAMIEANHEGPLHVRFTIDEGQPTLLTKIEISLPEQANAALCADILRELSVELDAPTIATRPEPGTCVVYVANLKFREDDVVATRDRLRDYLFKVGRPRAVVELATTLIEPHRVAARYSVHGIEQPTLGKIVLRGNFKTRESIIRGELQLDERSLLTQDALANAARRLRATGLFDAVNIDMPDLTGSSGVINAIVRVEERYDFTAEFDVTGGYSSYNGVFGTLGLPLNNLFGIGIQLIPSFTYGQKLQDYEATLRFPKFLIGQHVPRWFEFQADLTALYRKQDTPRFGLLTTEGASVTTTWIRPTARTPKNPAHTWNFGAHYDFRVRGRNVDALRPIGSDMDNSQVAISTRTGSVGVSAELEERVDRNGQLAPLAPERGFRVYATVAYASPILGGQDTFVKVSASGTKLYQVGDNLVLRGDLRYDEGFPLAGAVLLPEVERFFAGGDNTVRGYADDRLATEVVKVGVPPLGTVTQIRVIPAGGNIRTLASLDAQVRIWKLLAGALFTDAGMITNSWGAVTSDDIRPSVGMGLRALTPFGIGALEYAVPLRPHLGDDPRGRIHFYFAARAQF